MDLEDALLGIDKMPSTLTDEEKKRKDRKALTQLHLHLSNEILQDLMKEKTVAALWKRLEQICMSKTLTSKLHMKQRLYAHRLEEGVSVHEHLTVFKEILSNLEAMEVQYDKEDLGLILLCSLPPSYSTFRDTILYSRGSLTIDEVYDYLTSYNKMKHLVVKPDSQRESLIACGRQDRNADNDRGRTQKRNPCGKSKNKIKREAANQKGKQPENSGEADVVEDYSDGVGTIKVKMFDGVVRTLSDVRHVPELKRNLISLRQRKTAKLYVLQGSTVTGDAAVASSSLSDDDITKLWHMRLGHMSENGMGPSRVPSRGGANYMLTFIDDFSKKVWAFFLKQKNDVFSIVQVRRDHETLDSSSYSTVKQRCRMNEQNDHGEAYAHVDNGKLEPRSIKCVFLGYKAGVKGYKLWCPENRKVVISRDIVFDKTAMLPNLSLKYSSNKENQKQVEHQINTESTPQASTKIENKVASSLQYSIVKNRTRREIKPLKKYAEADLVAYALNVAEDIDANQQPSNYSEAISCEDSEKWMFAMQEEMEESLHKNKTWDLVKLPKGVDFTDVFFPVVKHSLIRALLDIVAMHDLELEQLNVKTVFLHGELEENIYMQQPEGFTVSEKEDYVCSLKKSLYGLKQSPRQWYKRFDSFMTSHNFKRSSFDSCVYFKKNSDGSFVYLLLYVDDMLIAAKDK
ncbi:hypothetical protein CXB51_008736 [Gossypium anomalum]|uniref:Retrovirus-related Pol polyprotein from transposon TNT 1-94 n=1 Tax=Gossypium anomalum TaxID=47600 RepID=A0A8J5Z0B6_9ROSI|nr:hypothetical protein CXB51_008736 [Gossypium anomalum]